MSQRIDLSKIETELDAHISNAASNGTGITKHIFLGRSNSPNEIWDRIGSSNDRAIELARAGAEEGVVVIARSQTSGRGRQGKVWVSPQESGIYLSLLLRPELRPAEIPLLGLATGVAVCQAIKKVAGASVELKWVNDIVSGGKKLGGILAEKPGASSNVTPAPVIIGVGLNLSLTDADLPEQLHGKTVCLDQLCGELVDANKIIAEFLISLSALYMQLQNGESSNLISSWKSHANTIGKRIRATLANESIEGLALDLAESGALIVRLDSGEERQLHAGEISIRLSDGSYA